MARVVTTIYVGNLALDSSPQLIAKGFRQFGWIQGLSWKKERKYAFIKFAKYEQALEAVSRMNGRLFLGTRIFVSFARFDMWDKNKDSTSPRKDDSSCTCPFSRLPDEMVVEILNKLVDLKMLCNCHLVSKRFSSLVLQVDTISFNVVPMKPPPSNKVTSIDGRLESDMDVFRCKLFKSAVKSLKKFKSVTSLSFQLPSFKSQDVDGFCFRWMVKYLNKVESFVFLSPNSVYTKKGLLLYGGDVSGNGQDLDEQNELLGKVKFLIACDCMQDMVGWCRLLWYCTRGLPLVEKVSITNSDKTGRISLDCFGKVAELQNWLVHESSQRSMCRCYIPLLELPVSGYVMKGITLVLVERNDLPDIIMNNEDDGLYDKEEAAYIEALTEIFKKHAGMIVRDWSDPPDISNNEDDAEVSDAEYRREILKEYRERIERKLLY